MKKPKVQILILMFAVYAYPVCAQSTPAQTALTTLEVVSNAISLLSIAMDKTLDKIDDVHRIQLMDLRSRASGVIITIKEREEANRNAEETLQIVEVDLNQSMELTWSLAQEYLKIISGAAKAWLPGDYGTENAFENAVLFTKLYTALGQLKIIIYQKSGRYSWFNDVPNNTTNKIDELNKSFMDTCLPFMEQSYGSTKTLSTQPNGLVIPLVAPILEPIATTIVIPIFINIMMYYHPEIRYDPNRRDDPNILKDNACSILLKN